MTGGGGLFAGLLCLLVATITARPQVGAQPPSWTIGGENVLENTRGNVTLLALLRASSPICLEQAYEMELLLQNLHDYGIEDVSFLIINSKDSASEDQFNELQRRVSFPVYQETDDEPVWEIMEGDVNDMFIYDRCGRLMYFIPFFGRELNRTLSMVRVAVFSTYFRSSRICSENEINIANDDDNQYDDENRLDNEEQQTIYNQNGKGVLQNIEDNLLPLQNDTNLENNEIPIDTYDTDYYAFDNSSMEKLFDYYDTNSTESDKINSTENDKIISTNAENITSIELSPANQNLLTSFIRFFWGDGKPSSSLNTNSTNIEPVSTFTNEIYDNSIKNNNDLNDTSGNESLASVITMEESVTKLPEADSCPGIDKNICMDWGKQKLMQAQRCCTIAVQDNGNRQGKHCKNLGKKRCKKIQPLLKCCLKTELQLEEESSKEVHETM